MSDDTSVEVRVSYGIGSKMVDQSGKRRKTTTHIDSKSGIVTAP